MISLSFDLDWAPAWATEWIARTMADRGLTGTFFVTHRCASLPRLIELGMELGVHPNYLPGSSHGVTQNEVLDYVQTLVPGAIGVRAHALVRSTPLWIEYAKRGFVYEASDLMDGIAGLRPLPAWNGLVRLPIYWEDDVHLMHGLPLEREAMGLAAAGMKVLNFHPILLALNSSSLAGYQGLKRFLAEQSEPLTDASEETVERFADHGTGVRALFEEVCDLLAADPSLRGGTLADLARAP
jgi:hypothetical protein